MKRILFARIGYMRYYQGCQEGNPVNGGSFNEDNIGHEVFNFRKEHDGFCYGFVEPANGSTISLKRIEPSIAENTEKLDNVLVIWLATEGNGQYVVGWYNHATVYSGLQSLNKKKYNRYPLDDPQYNIKCKNEDAVLLPISKRRQQIPSPDKKTASIGQANVFYFYEDKSKKYAKKEKIALGIHEAVKFAEEYTGPCLNNIEDFCREDDATRNVVGEDFKPGNGFLSDVELRIAIEKYAMQKCMGYLEEQGYTCKDVSKNSPYDVLAEKNGKSLKIEVKGTRGSGKLIIMTRNEVALARKNDTMLFMVSSIEVKKKKLIDGKITFREWNFSESNLIPLSYNYQIDEK